MLTLYTGKLPTLALISARVFRAFRVSIRIALIVKITLREVHRVDIVDLEVFSVRISFAELEDFWLFTDVKMSSLVTVSNTIVIACLV